MKKVFKKAISVLLVVVMVFGAGSFTEMLSLLKVAASNNISIPENALEFNGHYYAIINGNVDWTTANSLCRDVGGYLATITSESEQQVVSSLLASDGYGHSYWLGAYVHSGNIEWITGEACSYQNWSSGQPDKANDEQNYLRIYGRSDMFGEWDDFENSSLCMVGAVCEWDSTETNYTYLSSSLILHNAKPIYYNDGKFFTTEVKATLRITNAVSSSYKGDISSLPDAYISTVSMSSSNSNLLYCNNLDFSSYATQGISPGESCNITRTFYVNTDYDFDKNISFENVIITANVSVAMNGELQQAERSTNVTFKNNDYKEESSDNTLFSQSSKSAYDELKKIKEKSKTNVISLDRYGFLSEILTEEQLKYLEDYLYCLIVMSTIPEESFKEQLIGLLYEKTGDAITNELSKDISEIFGEYDSIVGFEKKEVVIEIAVNTDLYGPLIVEFNCDINKFLAEDRNFASYTEINYEVVDGKGMKDIPENKQSGRAGGMTTANIEEFSEAVEKVAVEAFVNCYDDKWGDDVAEICDILFDDGVDSIMSNSQYSEAAEFCIESMSSAGKRVKIRCPVDVFVYDSLGELCASVENDKVTKTCDKANISVEGSEKTIFLFDETYSIVIKPTGNNTTMDISVAEYANSDSILRTIDFEDVPLTFGQNYTQHVDLSYFHDESIYALTSETSDAQIQPDAVENILHLHYAINWQLIQSATCTQVGKEKGECILCGDVATKLTDVTDHIIGEWVITVNPTEYATGEKTRYCTECNTEMNKETIDKIKVFVEIRDPSTTTISYGDAIILYADVTGTLPEGAYIKWTASNSNFSYFASGDGTTCTISPSSSGDTIFTATVYDSNGNVISSDEQVMTSKAGFFDKIIAFFKKLFGLTKTIPQVFKGII